MNFITKHKIKFFAAVIITVLALFVCGAVALSLSGAGYNPEQTASAAEIPAADYTFTVTYDGTDFNAVSGEGLTVTSDASLTALIENIDAAAETAGSADIVKKIIFQFTAAADIGTDSIVLDKGTYVIENLTVEGAGTGTAEGVVSINGAKVFITGGDTVIHNTNAASTSAVAVGIGANGCELTVTAGEIRAENAYALKADYPVKITQTGGLIISAHAANDFFGTVHLGTNSGTAGATVFKMTGGILENTSAATSYAMALRNAGAGNIEISGGAQVLSKNCYTVSNSGTGNLSVSGGTINSVSGNAVYNNGKGAVSVSGGTVSSGSGGNAVYNTGAGKVTVSGDAVITADTSSTGVAAAIHIRSNGTAGATILEITGGTVGNTGTGRAVRVVNGSGAAGTAITSGNIVMTGGTVVSGGEGFQIGTLNGKITISETKDGGTVIDTAGRAVTVDVNATFSATAAASINITGGSVNSSGNHAVYNNTSGATVISGGAIAATASASYTVYNGAGDLTVSGGAISASGANAHAVYSTGTGEFTISGGAISASGADAHAVYNNGTGNFAIGGGAISASGAGSYAVYNYGASAMTIGQDDDEVPTFITSSGAGAVYLNNVAGNSLSITGGTVEITTTAGIRNLIVKGAAAVLEIDGVDIADSITADITLPAQGLIYDGTELIPDSASFTLSGLTLDTDYATEYSNNINAGLACFSAATTGGATFITRFEISKQAVTVTAPDDYDGGTLCIGSALPALSGTTPNGTYVLDAGQTLTEGTNFYNWTFIPDDAENYEFTADTGTIELTVVGHDLIFVAAAEATCTVNGNIEHWNCSVCNRNFTDDTGATEITESVVIVAAHTLTHTAAVAPTCTTAGNIEYWHCSVCDKNFSDDGGATEITGSVTLAATGHTYGTAWETDADGHWHECDCGEKGGSASHTAGEWITDTAATATTDGSKHMECSVCGYLLQTEAIPALGEKGLSGGAIAGIVIGSVAFAAIAGFAIFWFVIKKKTFADLGKIFKKDKPQE